MLTGLKPIGIKDKKHSQEAVRLSIKKTRKSNSDARKDESIGTHKN